MGLQNDLNELTKLISTLDFQLTDDLACRIAEESLKLESTPERLIELNMLVGVHLGSKGEFAHADEYFMACWPYAHKLTREGMYDWPWKEQEKENPVDTLQRIDLFQFIQPFYEVIEPKDYFAFFEFQLRCQEVVAMIRKGEYAKANDRLLGLFDHIPRSIHLQNDVLSELRKEFREQRKLDLQMQVFDMGTFYHYLGISYWLTSDLENAKINLMESWYFRKISGHYLDLYECNLNLGSVSLDLSDFDKSEEYYAKCMEIIFDYGNEIETYGLYHQLTILYRKMGKLTESLEFAIKANEISIDNLTNRVQAHSYHNLGMSYQYNGKIQKAILAYKEGYNISNNNVLKTTILTDLICLLNHVNDFESSEGYINEMERIYLDHEDQIIHYKILISKVNLKTNGENFSFIQEIKKLIEETKLNYIPRDLKVKGIFELIKANILQKNDELLDYLATQKIIPYYSLIGLVNSAIIKFYKNNISEIKGIINENQNLSEFEFNQLNQLIKKLENRDVTYKKYAIKIINNFQVKQVYLLYN
ncbi:MAG: tetratricopeptide repeat protein [Candidatus Heimdallarchaeota archaeon]|nr:tetratricopeptide repeat protein [Candidatus Heimdallarchaeota archaeon]